MATDDRWLNKSNQKKSHHGTSRGADVFSSLRCEQTLIDRYFSKQKESRVITESLKATEKSAGDTPIAQHSLTPCLNSSISDETNKYTVCPDVACPPETVVNESKEFPQGDGLCYNFHEGQNGLQQKDLHLDCFQQFSMELNELEDKLLNDYNSDFINSEV